MVVIITRDVAERTRGFLGSCMLEIGPGVYTSPRMSAGVRERVWNVLSEWHMHRSGSSVVMTWHDLSLSSGQGVCSLGTPPLTITNHDGFFLAHKS